MKTYPLVIENIGDDVCRYMSRGHHDPHEFMRVLRCGGYKDVLMPPAHLWFRAYPTKESQFSCRYCEGRPGAPGVFPVTYTQECSPQEAYRRPLVVGEVYHILPPGRIITLAVTLRWLSEDGRHAVITYGYSKKKPVHKILAKDLIRE